MLWKISIWKERGENMQQAILILEAELIPTQRDIEKFRGYIAGQFNEEVLLHNHQGDYEFRYKLPLVQYKIIEGKLGIVAYDAGIDVLLAIYQQLQVLELAGKTIKIVNKELKLNEPKFEVQDKLYKYTLATPWIALNQQNYEKYINGGFDLSRQMQNNLLSNFKDLGITVTQKIMCTGEFSQVKVILKDTKLIAFKGNFVSNVYIPSYMGIGKRKSIGYGTVMHNEGSAL